MDKEKVLGMIDHTLLKAVSTWPEIELLCDEAVKYHTASVCVPPCFIKRIHDQYGDALAICTVIGFPLGYNTTEIKVAETRQAIADGAVEVDMVVNLGDVKSGAFDKVTEEIRAVKQTMSLTHASSSGARISFFRSAGSLRLASPMRSSSRSVRRESRSQS